MLHGKKKRTYCCSIHIMRLRTTIISGRGEMSQDPAADKPRRFTRILFHRIHAKELVAAKEKRI